MTQNKEEGTITLNRFKFWMGFFLLILGILTPIGAGAVYLIKKDSLTYDSQERKITIENTVFQNKKDMDIIKANYSQLERRFIIFEERQKQGIESNEELKEILINLGGDMQEVKKEISKNKY